MKKLRWQLIIIFLTGLVIGILLIGEQDPENPIFVPEPVQGGIYTEALVGSFQRLNPILDFYNSVDRDVDRLLFCRMIRFDERGLPLSELVESWGFSQDGTIYNFTLQSGAVWHDGEPVTSYDIAFTVDLLKNGGLTIPLDVQEFWKNVEVRPLNDTNLQFKLPEPFAPFLDYLTFGILPEHILGGLSYDQIIDAKFNLQPVGCGPYRFSRLIIEEEQITGIELVMNDQYFGEIPFIEQIIFQYYPSSEDAFQAYREGTVQGINYVSPDVLPAALQEENLAIYSVRSPEISIIFLNLQNPQSSFFLDKAVRESLMLGLNRQLIVDTTLNGQAVVTDSPILPGVWAYYDGHERIPFDPDLAKATLKEAGYEVSGSDETVREKDGVQLAFTLLYPDDEQHQAIAEAIQRNWRNINIQVEIEPVPYDQLVNERLTQRDYEAALVDINLARSPDPDPYPFWDQVQATTGQNYSQWDNKMASEYLEQARVTVDIGERERLYHNFQVVFYQELPALPLYFPVYTYAIDKEIRGVQIGPLFDTSDRFLNISNWYLEARLPSGEKTPSSTP